MVDGEPVAARAQRDPDRLGRPASARHRRRMGIRPPVGQVQGAGRDEARRAVRGDVRQADDARRHRHRRRQPELHLGHAEDGDRLAKRLGRVGQAAGLVGAEVAGEAVRGPAGAPGEATGRAHGGPIRQRVRSVATARLAVRVASPAAPTEDPLPGALVRVEDELQGPRPGQREGVRRAPSAGPRLRERLRPGPVALEPGQRRLQLPAVLDAAEVVVEEPDELAQPVDVRARVRVVRERVDPVADDGPPLRVDASLLDPECRVDVRVAPAGHLEHGALERLVLRGQRAPAPVGTVGLLADPREQPRRRRLEPRPPLVAPPVATEGRPRRQGVHPELADRVLALLARSDAAAAEVDVVAIAVVGRVHRQDRPEMGRPEPGDLDRGEPAVADAPHPDVAVAPRLGRQPLDGVVPVARLVLGVLVEGDAGRAARAPDVEAAEREPAGGQPLAERRVPVQAPAVLPVRDHLEDGGEPLVRGSGPRRRPPQVGRQLQPVAHGDPDVPVDLGLVRGRPAGTISSGGVTPPRYRRRPAATACPARR